LDSETSFVWFDQVETSDLWILSKSRLFKKSIFSKIEKSNSTVLVQNSKEIGLTKYKEAAYPPPMFGES